MGVSQSAYYDWLKRPGKLIGAEELTLRRRMRDMFKLSRSSLGSREMKKLREEGFEIGRYRVRQCVAYKVTTKRNVNDSVAYNLLNQKQTKSSMGR